MRISDWSSDVCSSDLSRPGGREYLHQAARVGGRARAGVEDAFGADLGSDPRRVEQVFGGLAADGGFVVDREADFIPALLLGVVGDLQAEHAAVDPAVVLRALDQIGEASRGERMCPHM